MNQSDQASALNQELLDKYPVATSATQADTDPTTNQEFEDAAALTALLDAYPELKCENLYSFSQDHKTSQSFDSTLWYACCEWDLAMPEQAGIAIGEAMEVVEGEISNA